MGLMDLDGMDIPDNKGGRPPKEDEEEGREYDGDPLTNKKDDEDWWRENWEDVSGDPDEKITELSDHVCANPIDVRSKLNEHGIYETDWDEYKEKYTMYEYDQRLGGSSREYQHDESPRAETETTDLFSDSGGSDDDDPSTGLQSMIGE